MDRNKTIGLTEVEVEILQHAYNSLAAWIRERRGDEYRFFSWVNSVLIAIIGAILVFIPSGEAILDRLDKIVVSLAVILLTGVSHEWQRRSRIRGIYRAQILTGIEDRLCLRKENCFGTEEPVYPLVIQDQDPVTLGAKLGLTLYNLATLLMALLTLVVIWTR